MNSLKMKKRAAIFLLIACLLISIVSAEIIINQQPKDIYNWGDTISVPVSIKSSAITYGMFQMNLACSTGEINFYRNGISLTSGGETSVETSLPLIKEVVGETTGVCKIKAILIDDSLLTDSFRISNLIEVRAETNKDVYNPEEELLITGNATKESGSEITNGFVNITISKDGEVEIRQTEVLGDGKFSSKIKLPKDVSSGEHTISILVYETDLNGKATNKGSANYGLEIAQIPTNLEIVFEKKEINPGETLRLKAVLHDQTGEKIKAMTVISIKDQSNNIIEQVDKQSDEFTEYLIKEQQSPGEWKVIAQSSHITSESSFKINEQEKVNIEIINKTITITNVGNVPYNDTILVKIGQESSSISAFLKLGESKKYILTAPSGEYQVKILSSDGKSIEKSVILTGNAVSVKEISENSVTFIKTPLVWIFIIMILGFVSFLFFKKWQKKILFGHTSSQTAKIIPLAEKIHSEKNALVNPKNKANLSSSIKGTQQRVSAVCLKIKNHTEVSINKSSAKETLQKIVDMSESVKAYVHESGDSVLFLLVPSITKSLKNELAAADLAQSAKKVMDDYNKLFRQKISYGISLEHGDAVIKQEGNVLTFMGLGNLMANSKRLASISLGEVAVSEKMKEKIQSDVKLERQTSERGSYYIIKEIRDKEKHKTFLNSFVNRYEKDTKKQPSKEPSRKEQPEEEDDFDLDSLPKY